MICRSITKVIFEGIIDICSGVHCDGTEVFVGIEDCDIWLFFQPAESSFLEREEIGRLRVFGSFSCKKEAKVGFESAMAAENFH